MEANDEWQLQHRYLSVEAFAELAACEDADKARGAHHHQPRHRAARDGEALSIELTLLRPGRWQFGVQLNDDRNPVPAGARGARHD